LTGAAGWAFVVFALLALGTAIAVVVARNPIHSALFLLSCFLIVACIFILQQAEFVGAVQILVYAGGIMVLFLFVIMLLNLGREGNDLRGPPARVAAVAIALVLVAELLLLSRVTPGNLAVLGGVPAGAGSPMESFPAGAAGLVAPATEGVVGAIAAPLFQIYLVPFEITSILLLAAAVGAVVLAKRKL
jgi:NADH-quinone oxidoreductase subunit J